MVTPAHDTRIGTCEPADQPGLERIVNAARMASSTAARVVTGIAGADGQRAQRCQQPGMRAELESADGSTAEVVWPTIQTPTSCAEDMTERAHHNDKS